MKNEHPVEKRDKLQRRCPFCAEEIQIVAQKCRHCGEWLNKKPSAPFKRVILFVKNIILWVGSLYLWLIYAGRTMDRSEEAYTYTSGYGPVLSGYSVPLLAVLLAVLMRRQVFTRSKSIKSILAKGLVILLLVFGLYVQLEFDPFPFASEPGRYSQSERGIRQALARENELYKQRSEDSIRQVYREILSPKDRTLSEDEFVKVQMEFWKGSFPQVVTHSIEVHGDLAYVDQSVNYCRDTECKDIEKKTRSFHEMEYDKGYWYYRAGDILCPRDALYEMEPEFSRSLSLIRQRTSADSKSKEEKELAGYFSQVMNCVRITYASSDNEMKGAEGLFYFVPGQSLKEMTIYVSPRYQSKDDILTATLLTHELTHAYNYVTDLRTGEETGCFEHEARAFMAQNLFVSALNDEERQSLTARLAAGGSEELKSTAYAYNQIPRMSGKDYFEKALNFVKVNPWYQEQCKSE